MGDGTGGAGEELLRLRSGWWSLFIELVRLGGGGGAFLPLTGVPPGECCNGELGGVQELMCLGEWGVRNSPGLSYIGSLLLNVDFLPNVPE